MCVGYGGGTCWMYACMNVECGDDMRSTRVRTCRLCVGVNECQSERACACTPISMSQCTRLLPAFVIHSTLYTPDSSLPVLLTVHVTKAREEPGISLLVSM